MRCSLALLERSPTRSSQSVKHRENNPGHLNPAMTFTFYRLGKVEFWNAIFYGVAQFAGATAGVAIATSLLLGAPGNPTIRYAATVPGV